MSRQTGRVILCGAHGTGRDAWLSFAEPRGIIRAHQIEDVLPALREVECAVEAGCFAAGFICYEAAPAFDPALTAYSPAQFPLLWFGIYDTVDRVSDPLLSDAMLPSLRWSPSISRDAYAARIHRIKEAIARGETYQVNFTYRLRTTFNSDAWQLFSAMYRSQRTDCAAYVDTGEHAICSASPELFFSLEGHEITCKPMKGTASRGRTTEEDGLQAARLQASPKNRAENLMIADMVRSDLGRVALTGSVRVPRLFEVERFDTVWQMTSTVTAETRASLGEIFTALFPGASITGAPKVQTMRLIRSLESAPRGIYTGCIGYVAPGRQACFNIAIRTVHVNRTSASAEFGVGGGVVWDSTPADEYDESLTKALIVTRLEPPFELLETILWRPDAGYFLLDLHLSRIEKSAGHFGYPFNRTAVLQCLEQEARRFTSQRWRVRLLLDSTGVIRLDPAPLLSRTAQRFWRVVLARRPVDRNERFLYHKTTSRLVYESARRGLKDFDDVILWNLEGEVTESTLANIVIRRNGELVTPPASSGLLAGVYRAHMLARKRVREGIVRVDELKQAEAVFLINSVRGWIPAKLES